MMEIEMRWFWLEYVPVNIEPTQTVDPQAPYNTK